MAKLIRKISIGKDYKNDAMHYAVGQDVYGGHRICNIIEEEDKFSIYIKKEKVMENKILVKEKLLSLIFPLLILLHRLELDI